MKTSVKLISGVLMVLALDLSVRAGSITNNFDMPVDYLITGVAGTMWDGVYFGAGDVPGGAPGVGTTLAANTTTLPVIGGIGYLYVQSTGGGWEGAQDDGFFLFKNVAGDFDASVEITASPFQSFNYHFAGLLARASIFPTGAPFNPTGTNAAESFVNLTRFQEFSIGDSVRMTSNGVLTVTRDYPGDDSDTNTTRFVRLVRSGDTFNFYDKTNATDAWSFKTNLTRPDLHGVVMQVGIEQAVYTGNSPFAAFTDFELSGPNVTNVVGVVTPPADPSGVAFSSPTFDGHLTVSWTPGAGSSGSLVLLRAATNSLITQVPAYGFTYTGDPNFAAASNSFGGQGYHLVYVGSGNNVTVSGLGGDNNTYSAAVFSYLGGGSSIIYGTNPATGSATGPGQLTNVTFTLSPPTIPVGGAAGATVFAFYSTGDSYDVSSAPATVWSSSDPSRALAANGTVTGLAPGTNITISANYRSIVGTNLVSVHPPAYIDTFMTPQDYLANGLPGSTWDGLYLNFGDIPNGNSGGGAGVTVTLNANISSNNILTMASLQSGWENGEDDGPFLFKNVTGDFEVSAHIVGYTPVGYHFIGLMARQANPDGSPPAGGENHLNWWRFDQFGVTSSARSTMNAGTAVTDQNDGENVDYWLLMARANATNFYFFKKQNTTDPWTFVPAATFVRPDLNNVSVLQVGLAQSTYTPNTGTAWFDSFMLDGGNLALPLPPPPPATNLSITFNPDLSMTLSWTVGTNADGTAIRTLVVMRAGGPVTAQPNVGAGFTGNSVFGDPNNDLGGGNYAVYRTPFGSTSTQQTVTVTGLSPGVQYYAAVYTFVGLGTSRTFNTATTAYTNLVDGHLVGIQTVSSTNAIPVGGVGTPLVYGVFTGGGLVPITGVVEISSDNPSIVIGTNGVLTGLAVGSTTVHLSYAGFTNDLAVSVRAHTYSENFGVTHDYVLNGVTGTTWDGVYLGANSFPNQGGGNDGVVSTCDANVTAPNTLTVTSTLTDWAGGADDGFLLFKYVPADFQVAVHIASLTKTVNYLFAGLMARAFSTNGAASRVGTNNLENWVYLGEFDQFNDDIEARRALNGVDREFPGGPGTNDWWILIQRQNGTNFNVYKRLNGTDPWIPLPSETVVQPMTPAGVPMQVGLFAATYTDLIGTVQFDNFMLDLEGEIALSIRLAGSNVIIRWPTSPGATLQSSTRLNPANWQPVGGGSTTTPDGYSEVSLSPGGSASFFRLVH